MSEPQRLLNRGGGASPLERTLLEAARTRPLPKGTSDRVLASVVAGGAVAGLANAAAAATSGTAGASKAAAGSMAGGAAGKVAVTAAVATTKAKFVIGGILFATAVSGSYVGMRSPATGTSLSPVVSAPQARERAGPREPLVTAPQSAPVGAPESLLDTPPSPPMADVEAPRVTREPPQGLGGGRQRVAQAAPSMRATADLEMDPPSPPIAPVHAPTSAPADVPIYMSHLREEAALVERARAKLVAGDVSAAVAAIAEADARFPRGGLQEEREALRVRAAFAAGDRMHGQALARDFLARYPSSPLGASVRAFSRMYVQNTE